MKVQSSAKLATVSILAVILVILTSWWAINSFVQLMTSGQGWPALVTSVLAVVFSAKLLPYNNAFRSFLRDLWAKA